MTCLRSARIRGFTLIEVLIALIVISIGLLGIAAIQASAISNTHSSQTESLVAIQARSLADAMAANANYWAATGIAPADLLIQPAANGTTAVLSDAGLTGATVNCSTTSCVGSNANATALNVAAYDVKTWGTNLFELVPGSHGEIQCVAGSPVTCSVSVYWPQKAATAINGATQNGPAPASTMNVYTLVNQI